MLYTWQLILIMPQKIKKTLILNANENIQHCTTIVKEKLTKGNCLEILTFLT